MFCFFFFFENLSDESVCVFVWAKVQHNIAVLSPIVVAAPCFLFRRVVIAADCCLLLLPVNGPSHHQHHCRHHQRWWLVKLPVSPVPVVVIVARVTWILLYFQMCLRVCVCVRVCECVSTCAVAVEVCVSGSWFAYIMHISAHYEHVRCDPFMKNMKNQGPRKLKLDWSDSSWPDWQLASKPEPRKWFSLLN